MHDYDYDDEDGPGTPRVEVAAELRLNAPTLDLNAKVDGGTVADLIVKAALAKLVKGDEWNTVKDRVREITDEEIRAHAKTQIAEALNGGIRKTNTFGEPYGEPTTLRALIAEEVRAELAKAGDPYRGKDSTVRTIVREQVAAAFKTELVEAIAEEKAKVIAAVRASAADLIAQAVAAGVGGAR